MSYDNTAPFTRPNYEPPLQIPSTQDPELGGYTQSQLEDLYRMNLSQYADNRVSSLRASGLSDEAQPLPLQHVEASGAFPPPPFPPIRFPSADEMASLIKSHSDQLRHDVRQNTTSPPQVPLTGLPATKSTGNDPGKSDTSSTSEMDLEDGEVSDEGSKLVGLNVDKAQYLSRIERDKRYAASDSVIEMRRRATAALGDLHAQQIDFATLVKEGIDRKILIDLYGELGIAIPKDHEEQINSEESETQLPQPMVTEKARLGQAANNLQPPTTNASQNVLSSSKQPALEVIVGKGNRQGQSADGRPQPVVADIARQQKASDRHAPQLEDLSQGQKPLDPAKIANPKVPVAATKAMDRKDYIARMLEARKKNLPKSTQVSESPVLNATEVARLAPKSKTMSEASNSSVVNAAAVLDSATQNSGDQTAPTTTEPSKPPSGKNNPDHNANAKAQSDLEAKKKAQTELARQKMEALLNRGQSKITKPSSPPKSVITEPVSQKTIPGRDAPGVTSAISPPRALESAMPGTIISPRIETSFNIPGLFTGTNQPALHVEPSVTPPVSTPKNAAAPTADGNASSQPSIQAHQAKPIISNDAISTAVKDSGSGERHITSSRLTGSRKRQKAADFIESPPPKSKRRLGSGDDTSVIIEVSDDELYGDTPEEAAASRVRQVTPQESAIEVKKQAHNQSSSSPSIKSSALADAPPITPSRGLGAARGGEPNGTIGLKSKEKAIEEMQRRIAELEQRRKAKSRTSRAQTPGTPAKDSLPLSFQNTPPPTVSALTSRAEEAPSTLDSAPPDTSDAGHKASALDNADIGPSNSIAHDQDEVDAMEAVTKTLPSPLSEHKDRAGTSETIHSNSLSPRGQAQHQPIASVGAVDGGGDRVGSEKEGSIRSTMPSLASPTAVHKLSDQRNPTPNSPNDGKPLPFVASKNALPGGNSEVQTTMLRLEQLRAEMAFLEQQLQAGVKGKQDMAQRSENPLALTNTPPTTDPPASLPAVGPASISDSTQQEAAIRSDDVKEITSNDATESEQVMRAGAPPTSLHSKEPIGFKGSVPNMDSDEPTEEEYDPAEDAMDLSQSDSEQGEIIERVHDDHPVLPPEQIVDKHTPKYTDLVNAQTEEVYEPPATFENLSAPSNDPSSTSDYEPQDREPADMIEGTAEKHDAFGTSNVHYHESTTPTVPLAADEKRTALAGSSSSTDASSSVEESLQEIEYEPPGPKSRSDPDPPMSNNAVRMNNAIKPVPVPEITHGVQATLVEDECGVPTDVPEMVIPEIKAPTFNPAVTGKQYTPYQSPLKLFKDYRYHPKFLLEASQGFRSNTYSNSLNDKNPLCPYGTLGTCNDPTCRFQHLDKIKLSDDKILVQLGSAPASLNPEQQDKFRDGLRNLIGQMRTRNVRDFSQLVAEIVAYRQEFLGDKSKILAL